MGDAEPKRQDEGVYRPLVAFDFDGTLTWKDSFLAFLAWLVGPARYAGGMLRLAPAGLAYLRHRDRGRLKAAAVREFLAGMHRDELEKQAQRFATEHARALLRPDAMRAWKQWQAQGARLLIVTASPEIIVAPFARGLGADRIIGTRLVFDQAGRVTGAFFGANCRGPEKVARLRAIFGDDVRLAAAYGDTSGDTEMLGLAEDTGFKVFQGKPG